MIKCKLVLLLVMIMGSVISIQAQIRIADEVEKELYRSGKNTVYEMGVSKLKDGQIKLYYRSQAENDRMFAEIFLKDESDFNDLYEIMADVFKKKPDLPVKADLGDSYLYIYYTDMLFGQSEIKLGHAYKTSPYQSILSKPMGYKDIKKLFNKQ